MIEIPKQLKNNKFRFVLLKKKSKIPFEKEWQSKNNYAFTDLKLWKHLKQNGNYGVVGGYGNLRILDIDNPKLIDKFDAMQTFTVKTGGGGRHLYFISDYQTNHVLRSGEGELRANNYQVVGTNCIHPNGNKYEIIKDLPIMRIEGKDLRRLLEPYIRTDEIARTTDVVRLSDKTRSGIEFGEVCRLIKKGWNKKRIFERMMNFDKWSKAKPQYRATTYKKALKKQQHYEIGDESPESLKILKTPKLLDNVVKEIQKKVVGEIETIKTIFLATCGRLVTNATKTSYNLMINDESGSGKDWVTDKTLDIWKGCKEKYHILKKGKKDDDYEEIEKETNIVIKRTRISEKVFTYWHNPKFEPDWTWDRKVFYNEDISNRVLNSDVFKVMASSGSFATILIDQYPTDIEIAGKPVMLITTASANPKPENIRRFAILNLDTTVDQTLAIMKRQAKYAKKGMSIDYDHELCRALKNLKPIKVKIPFAEQIPDVLPKQNIIMRTFFERFLDFIKASCALYQKQRETDEDGWKLATEVDYENARRVILKLTSNIAWIPLTKNQKRIIKIFDSLDGGLQPTLAIESKVAFLNRNNLRENLDKLTDKGLLSKGKVTNDRNRELIAYSLNTRLSEIDIPKFSKLSHIIPTPRIPIPAKLQLQPDGDDMSNRDNENNRDNSR